MFPLECKYIMQFSIWCIRLICSHRVAKRSKRAYETLSKNTQHTSLFPSPPPRSARTWARVRSRSAMLICAQIRNLLNQILDLHVQQFDQSSFAMLSCFCVCFSDNELQILFSFDRQKVCTAIVFEQKMS